MKRWYLVAVVAVGLCPVAARAQEGLAPTVPVVPAPVLQNGNVLTPSGGSGWGATGSPRLFSVAKWSPFRNPATASPVEPTAYAPAYVPTTLPPLPSGVGAYAPEGNCGPGGCDRPGRSRSCWARIKAFLAFHDSPTELPTCRPTPYITPLQGMFPCTSVPYCGAGCADGSCGIGVPANGQPVYGQPQPLPYAPQGQPMPQPVVPPGTTAGPVVMPPRGMQAGPVQPTWQGRVVPASAVSAKPTNGPVVPTGYRYPAPK
ncbi:MAG: hypothetical protein J0I06_11440 [Planctomycetes bacterium]|nr:hypothetical protein [Planctomycetota bacterium]